MANSRITIKIIVLFLPLFVGGCGRYDTSNLILDGKPLPAFSILLSDSTYINTENFSSKQTTVLFYFSPVCPYSKLQMKDIITNITLLQDVQFYIITDFPFARMRHFYTEFNLWKYPNMHVGVDIMNFFSKYYEVKGAPTITIYGRGKKNKGTFLGLVKSRMIQKMVNEK